jgi:glycerol uptake facilitator-like aquaporin
VRFFSGAGWIMIATAFGIGLLIGTWAAGPPL